MVGRPAATRSFEFVKNVKTLLRKKAPALSPGLGRRDNEEVASRVLIVHSTQPQDS